MAQCSGTVSPLFSVSKTITKSCNVNTCTQLAEVDSYKFLGLILDLKLDFQIHLSNLKRIIHQRLSYFSKIGKYITVDAAFTIYKATILPLLDYADIIYEQQVKYINKQLQGLQTKGLRIVYN